MKNKIKKSKTKKNNNFLHNILSVYWMMFCTLSPIIICVMPVIPFLLTDNSNWMWLTILSFPFGIATAMKTWDIKFLNKINYE